MTSQARIEANRANARKSTGPRTTEGKARAALNALQHGFRSQIVLRRSSPQDAAAYTAYLDSLLSLFQPVGPLESQCVETMALADWRKRLVIDKEFDLQNEPDPAYPKFVDRTIFDIPRIPPPPPPPTPTLCLPFPEKLVPLLRYEAHLTREYRTAFRQLTVLQARRLGGDPSAAPAIPDLPSAQPPASNESSVQRTSPTTAAQTATPPSPQSVAVPSVYPLHRSVDALSPHLEYPAERIVPSEPNCLQRPGWPPALVVPQLLYPWCPVHPVPLLRILVPNEPNIFPHLQCPCQRAPSPCIPCPLLAAPSGAWR